MDSGILELYVFRFIFLKRSEAGGRRQEAGRLITEYCSLVSVCVEVLTEHVSHELYRKLSKTIFLPCMSNLSCPLVANCPSQDKCSGTVGSLAKGTKTNPRCLYGYIRGDLFRNQFDPTSSWARSRRRSRFNPLRIFTFLWHLVVLFRMNEHNHITIIIEQHQHGSSWFLTAEKLEVIWMRNLSWENPAFLLLLG